MSCDICLFYGFSLAGPVRLAQCPGCSCDATVRRTVAPGLRAVVLGAIERARANNVFQAATPNLCGNSVQRHRQPNRCPVRNKRLLAPDIYTCFQLRERPQETSVDT